jgi:hypothetical protein
MSSHLAPKTRSRFFIAWASVLLAITFVGFAPSFFLKAWFQDPGQVVHVAAATRDVGLAEVGAPALPVHAIVHGLFGTAWIVLFFVQTLLIARGRATLHRKLGMLGAFVGAGVALSGITALCLAFPRMMRLTRPEDPAAFVAEHLPSLAGDLGSFLAFAAIVAAAIHLRYKAETHKRLMLVATLILIPPALARFWILSGVDNALEVWFPLTENGLALAIIASDWILRRRAPWAIIAPFAFWVAVYGVMTVLGSTETAHTWALEFSQARAA